MTKIQTGFSRACGIACVLLGFGLTAAICDSQEIKESIAISSRNRVEATRMIPLYYSRDTEKVIAMVRDPVGQPVAPTRSLKGDQQPQMQLYSAPVDQVQITVAGEGLLHLRGPLEGVNAITRMVYEIDQPVGQIKLGFHVAQFTVPDDAAVEGVHGAVDLYLSHARQMSQKSQQLFRTALANVAAQCAASNPGRFEEAFFYGPCLENIRRLSGGNVSLSVAMLDSRDILTTLFLVALANQEVRQQVVIEFQRLAAVELPKLHEQYQQSIGGNRDSNAAAPSFFDRFKGGTEKTEPSEPRSLDYRFSQTLAFLNTIGEQSNSVHPIQIATVRYQLAAMKLRQSELALQALRSDRMLLTLTSSKTGSSPSVPTWSGDVMDAASFSKLADSVIEDHASHVLDLQEILRSEVATLDALLKRVTEAFEEDMRAQFWKPVLADLRRDSGKWKSRMGQIQSTTLLTPDRTLARVSPGQVAVLDRPVRPVLLQEGLQVAQGLAQEADALSQAGAILAAGNALAPGSSGYLAKAGLIPTPGQHLEKLADTSERITVSVGDDVAVTPVIQPDGFSVAFHLMYAHTPKRDDTSETANASGVQRHIVQADVTIPSLDLQEVSRFRVSLNTEEQGSGVPLLEDIPGLGVMFRPRRVTASMTQENIILVGAVVYPSAPSLAEKLQLAFDQSEFNSVAGPMATGPHTQGDREDLAGWVAQTLRRKAQASLADERFPQRIANPSGPAVPASQQRPIFR
ncbi:hypothetical protein Poly41_64960 [Novipirellula artificiosorum]|uniref:Uncharacterized protein n=1 Tax=Novipirellula artificiosorum TaxID=2528016 RepID=A0A5C6D1K2_9BACT|nr:hypothetical protein Poly41_64960 [Novipirellula artificiosorum]